MRWIIDSVIGALKWFTGFLDPVTILSVAAGILLAATILFVGWLIILAIANAD